MALDIDVPSPPDLTNRGDSAQFDPVNAAGSAVDQRRQELESILRDGAWLEAWEEWAQYTDLSEADVERAEEMGLFGSFDFFWDTEDDRLRYVTPTVPDEWDDRTGAGDVSASIARTELADLGRTVAETIASHYVDWGTGEPSDIVWSVDTFGQSPTGGEDEL